MDFHFFSNFETGMDARLAHYLSSTAANLCAILAPIVASAIVVYIMLIGYAVMRGEAQDSLHASMWKLVKWSLIAGVALSVGGFNTYIVGGLNGLESALFQATTGAPSGGALLDSTVSQFIDLFNKLNDNMKSSPLTLPDFGILVSIIILSLATLIYFGFATCVFMLAKVAGVLVLALGPAFIVTLIFPPIQRFADAWLSAALNTIIIKVLAGMVLAISTMFLTAIVGNVVANFDTSSLFVNIIEILILSVAFGFILGYIPMLSASLVGGSPMPHLTLPRLQLPQSPQQPSSSAAPRGGSIRQGGGSGSGSRNAASSPTVAAYRRNVIAYLPK
ncbi:MAG TPA: type IV secretion system protein [Asticcacaulis sp.]|nr:type IV secretion system protein [Asticcacaulis sp.]